MSADRDQLAVALDVHAWRGIVDVRFALDALLPVVDRIANERAAAELEAAADDQDASTNHVCDSPHWLRDRADALRTSNGEG